MKATQSNGIAPSSLFLVVRCQSCSIFQVLKTPQSICDNALAPTTEASQPRPHRFRCKVCHKDSITSKRAYYVGTAPQCRMKCQDFSLAFANSEHCEPLSDLNHIIIRKVASSQASSSKDLTSRHSQPQVKAYGNPSNDTLPRVSSKGIEKSPKVEVKPIPTHAMSAKSDSSRKLCRPTIQTSIFLRTGEVPPPPPNLFQMRQSPNTNPQESPKRSSQPSPRSAAKRPKTCAINQSGSQQQTIEDFFAKRKPLVGGKAVSSNATCEFSADAQRDFCLYENVDTVTSNEKRGWVSGRNKK